MAKIIVLFNHKGGVSKTTSTFNIGWKIASKGYKVMLVDADPQCNLSSLFLGESFDDYYTGSNEKNNIMDGVRFAFEGIPEPIVAIDIPIHPRNSNLYLLPGHMNLSEFDPQLTFAINSPATLTAMKNLPGAYSFLIHQTADKYHIDYVLIDLNPGLNTTNQLMFITSDAFIIPTNPDIFCEMAILSLSRILPNWVSWKIKNSREFQSSSYPLGDTIPKYIGELIQRFNIRKGKPASQFNKSIMSLKNIVTNNLVPSLSSRGMLYQDIDYVNAGISRDFCLAEIKDFQSLGQRAHSLGIPVFAIKDNEMDMSGAVLIKGKETRTIFDELFNEIADKILKLVV